MTSSIKNISLYIPHIFENFSKKDVTDVFEYLKIGKVNYIDFIAKLGKDGKEYNSAYIHFDFWYNNQVSINFQNRVLNPDKEARLVYDDPWYWIVLENKGNKVTPGQRKIRIDLGDLDKKNSRNPECPTTPIKLAKIIPNNNKKFNLIEEFDNCIEKSGEYDLEMQMCKDLMEQDDKYLAYFDKRYVETIEKENYLLRTQIYQLQNALYLENIKSSTLEENIGKLNQESKIVVN